MPAPSSNESYLPCKRRWNGSLTDAKYDCEPCDATVLPVWSSARPKTCSDALSVRSEIVTSGEKKFGTAPDGVGDHHDAAGAGLVCLHRTRSSCGCRSPPRRSCRSAPASRRRAEATSSASLPPATACGDGVERNRCRSPRSTPRLLAVRVIPDEERVGLRRRRQRRADRDRVDVEQRVRLHPCRSHERAVLPDLARIGHRERRIEPADACPPARSRVGRVE